MNGQGSKHKNYEILNLIGYGLAKFDVEFVMQFGFKSKSSFYRYLVANKIAETEGVVKNRQDLFDPFFVNLRKGWWQKGKAYIHRKILIDNLFGTLNATDYGTIVKLYLQDNFKIVLDEKTPIIPIIKSKFKQLQITGQEAEIYFLNNYNSVSLFKNGRLEDARLFGDGYDFQIEVNPIFYLAEVKGIRSKTGSIRLTSNEYRKAIEQEENFVLGVISQLEDVPKITIIQNPIKHLRLVRKEINSRQINYHSQNINW
jgi:hypothetical protein